jgi:hypothetical protein
MAVKDPASEKEKLVINTSGIVALGELLAKCYIEQVK